jgi:polyribonucleotide 5'-hydroxyl-kinase
MNRLKLDLKMIRIRGCTKLHFLMLSDEKEWKLKDPNSEFRFELDPQASINLTLTEGKVECFGAELAPNHEYEITGPIKQAVFTFEGNATLKIKGGPLAVEYISADAVVQKYTQIYQQIYGANPLARNLIVGEGRNSLARTFTNYGIRLGSLPLLVNLDVKNGSVLFPGLMCALPSTPDRIYEITDFRGCLFDGSSVSPSTFFFGHLEIKENMKLFKKQVQFLSNLVRQRNQRFPQPINIISPVDLDGDDIFELIEAFNLTAITVVGNERLYNTLLKKQATAQASPIQIIKAPKSSGYVPRDSSYRRLEQQRQFQGYFYGSHNEYTPFASTVNFSDVIVFRVSEGTTVAPTSALPLGATRKVDETRLARLSEISSSQLLFSIMAVSSAKEEARVADSSAAGFVYVTAVDESKGTLTLLSPCPGELYSKFLLLGSIKWIEK